MSESDVGADKTSDSLNFSAARALSAGSLLRKAREDAGLHIAALAVAMKVPVKKLEALESDRFDLLPDAVFVRAFALSVCRTLKMDPTPVVERLPHSVAPRLHSEDRAINVPFKSSTPSSYRELPLILKQPAVWLVLVFLCAALAVFLFPVEQSTKVLGESEHATVESPVIQNNGIALGGDALSSVGNLAAAVPPSEFQLPAPIPVIDPPIDPVNIEFQATAAVWVQVSDAKGTVLLSKNMKAGETVNVSASAIPLSVVVGRAEATRVLVRGKLLDIQAIAKENIARFEVK